MKGSLILVAIFFLATQVLTHGPRYKHHHHKYRESHHSHYENDEVHYKKSDVKTNHAIEKPKHDEHFDKIQKYYDFGGSLQLDALIFFLSSTNVKADNLKVDSSHNRIYVKATGDIIWQDKPWKSINAEVIMNFTSQVATFWFNNLPDLLDCYYINMSGNANITELTKQLQTPLSQEGGFMQYVQETTKIPDRDKTQGNFSQFFLNFTGELQATQLINIYYDMNKNGSMRYLTFLQPGILPISVGVNITEELKETTFTDDDFKIKEQFIGTECEYWKVF